jgi:hypothetical protein
VEEDLADLDARIDSAVLVHAQSTCYALTQSVLEKLPRELRDAIQTQLLQLLTPAQLLSLGHAILSSFPSAPTYWTTNARVPFYLSPSPAYAPTQFRCEVLEALASLNEHAYYWGSSRLPLTPSLIHATALDTHVPGSYFLGRWVNIHITIHELLGPFQSVDDTFVARIASLVRGISPRRSQSLELEFRLKGLRYKDKLAFKQGLEGVMREVEDGRWRDVKVYWIWGRA